MPGQGYRKVACAFWNHHWLVCFAASTGTIRLEMTSCTPTPCAGSSKHAVKLAGLDASKYSSHSARARIRDLRRLRSGCHWLRLPRSPRHRGMQSLQRYLRVVDQRRTKSLL